MELCHVVGADAWAQAAEAGQYAPPELGRDGFLHCCTQAQLAFVLARHFADAAGLAVVTFETDQLQARLDWVKSEPDQPPFPHLFGPIPMSAVRSVSAVDASHRRGL
jgi:uncharacterized protein (DUF952 family)